jgi:hypothetical protein
MMQKPEEVMFELPRLLVCDGADEKCSTWLSLRGKLCLETTPQPLYFQQQNRGSCYLLD